MAELTPMMRQYLQIKERNPDCILFFRLGDFYEMFAEDAKLASKELDLTLTTRDRGKQAEDQVPMCGVPYHSSESYIARLVAKGYKVAICEQMEDPALAKGLVRRDIVRVVTPGTVTENSMLDESRNNYFASVYETSGRYGLCFCDLSTGSFYATSCSGDSAEERVINELGRFMPAEALLSGGAAASSFLQSTLQDRLSCLVDRTSEKPIWPSASRLWSGSFPPPARAWALPRWRRSSWPPDSCSTRCTRAKRRIYSTFGPWNTTSQENLWSWIWRPVGIWS